MLELKIQAETAADLRKALADLAAEFGVGPAETTVKVVLTEPAPAGTPKPELPWGKDNPVDLVDVRKVGSEYVKTGKRDQLKAILDSFEIAKIPDCPKERLGELMEALKNGLAE